MKATVGHACLTCGGWMPQAPEPGECFACEVASEREVVRAEVVAADYFAWPEPISGGDCHRVLEPARG